MLIHLLPPPDLCDLLFTLCAANGSAIRTFGCIRQQLCLSSNAQSALSHVCLTLQSYEQTFSRPINSMWTLLVTASFFLDWSYPSTALFLVCHGGTTVNSLTCESRLKSFFALYFVTIHWSQILCLLPTHGIFHRIMTSGQLVWACCHFLTPEKLQVAKWKFTNFESFKVILPSWS